MDLGPADLGEGTGADAVSEIGSRERKTGFSRRSHMPAQGISRSRSFVTKIRGLGLWKTFGLAKSVGLSQLLTRDLRAVAPVENPSSGKFGHKWGTRVRCLYRSINTQWWRVICGIGISTGFEQKISSVWVQKTLGRATLCPYRRNNLE